MALPDTYKAWHRTTGPLPNTIELSTEILPKELSPSEVLIKIHAIALNFRDVGMLDGRYISPTLAGGIPASDCAAEVIGVGSGVTKFEIGDRVMPHFFVNYLAGDEESYPQGLGGEVDGVLREYAVFDERVLVRQPAYLSWDEASTIPCAGVTAWVALNGLDGINESHTVLLEGTGGVSLFALIILVAAGIKTVITSSSDEKLATIQKISPLINGINYNTTPDVAAEVQRITEGKGAKLIVNNAGVTTMPDNISSLGAKGIISMVGFLEALSADWNPGKLMGLMTKRGKLQGVAVGSMLEFEALNEFLDTKKVSLRPLIDRIFTLEEAKESFDYLNSGRHVGKIIVKP